MSLEDRLAKRRALFGNEDLARWKPDLDNNECPSKELQAAIITHFRDLDLKSAGSLEIPQSDLAAAIRQTGPGGGIIITVKATALKTEVTFNANSEIETKQTELKEADLADAEKEHVAERKFEVKFGAPRGVTFAIGPFITNLHHKEFERTQNRDHDPENEDSSELVIGLSEDSENTYGVAAYWNAPLTRGGAFGIAWGVGFNTQGELEESVNGLIGLYVRPLKDSPAQFSFGAAVGPEKDLDDGWDTGDPIGASEEIPVTTELRVRLFFGISFGFGG